MLRSTLKLMLAGCLLVALSRGASAAETINRKRDKPLSGDVTDVSKTEVTIKVKSPKEDTLKIPANEIQSISWTGETPDANLARSDENAGKFQRAHDGFQKALQGSKSTNGMAKVELEYAIARTLAKLALGDPSRSEEAIKKLEEFRSKHSDHYRFYDGLQWLGQLYLAKKDFVKAQLAFDSLGRAPWKDTQLAARIATGRLLTIENKGDEAIAAFDEVLAEPAEGALAESQRQEASLGKSKVLIGQKKFDDARKILEEVIAKAAPEDAKVHAEAYVRLGDCLREQGQDKDALLAYLHVDVLFPAEKAYQAEALFHLTRLWEKVGNKGRATEARDKLESDEFKASEWAQQLKAPAAASTATE